MNHIKINNQTIKKHLIGLCQAKLNEMIQTIQAAVKDAQKSANDHVGAMESRYDTFKEEAQDLNYAYSKHLEVLFALNSKLKDISVDKTYAEVDYGAIVSFEDVNYFIFSNIFDDSIMLNGSEYISISLSSPLGSVMYGKKINEEFEFNKNYYKILDVC